LDNNTSFRFTLDAIGLAGFGYDFQSIENPSSNEAMLYNSITKDVRRPLFFFFPFLEKHMSWAFPKRQQAHKHLDILHGLFDSIIANKRKVLAQQKERHEDPEKDLLTLMIEAGQDDPSQALSNEELREDLSIFFTAGHDTTSNALSFALYFLAVNPDVQQKARKEVIDVMGEEPDTVIPTEAQLSELKYLFMVMKEVGIKMNTQLKYQIGSLLIYDKIDSPTLSSSSEVPTSSSGGRY
jgi:cytochrome P450